MPPPPLAEDRRRRLTELYSAHHPLVWRVLRRHGLERAQADDGAQQVFLVALKRLDELKLGEERAFLCATALMVARKVRLKPVREVASVELPELDSGQRPDEQTEARRHRAQLDAVLARLKPELRDVFVLQDIEGLSKRETADALNIPQGTVATRLRRARAAFDELLRSFERPQP